MKRVYSIRWKLILSYVLLSVGTASAVGVISYLLITNYANKSVENQMRITAEGIEREIGPLFLSDDLDELRIVTDTLGIINNARIRVLDLRREAIFDTHPGGVSRFMTERGIYEMMLRLRPGANGRTRIDPRITRPEGSPGNMMGNVVGDPPPGPANPDGRVFTTPVRQDGGVVGYVELLSPPDLLDTTLGRSRLFLLFSGIAAAAVAILVGSIMGRRLTSPLLRVGTAVTNMAKGDLTVRADVNRNDEIGVLASQVNQMADRIETSIVALRAERDSLQAFAQDASHELRTPVTALQTFNELLLGRSGEDPIRRDEFLRDSQAQLDRLKWIVQALLTLTRFDAELVELEAGEYELAEIANETARGFEGRLNEKQISLSVTTAGNSSSTFDRESIVTALSNIIDNAIKFSPRGSAIRLESGSRDEGSVYFICSDDGPGIADEDLPYVFKRFYRSKTSDNPGSGLGLSLVESIVRAHRGSVEIVSEGAGTSVVITLPGASR